MVNVPSINSQVAKNLCRLVGFACLAGFLFDMAMIVLPPDGGATWRVGVLQQMGDRSIVFLFGLALLLYGFWEDRGLRKIAAYLGLGAGVLFLLCSILVIRDSLILQDQAVTTISDQASELQTQIEEGRSNPEVTANVTPEQLDEAMRQVAAQADALKQNAKVSLTKTAITSTGNLLIIGISLLGLGRMALPRRPRKKEAYSNA